jgi:2-oxoglutarate ferredoxin oxidoreductase subunit gamma
MEERMIFAGAGGQGLMLSGKVMALAAINDGLNVTYFPSYGAEVRGGTAHCHVVVATGEIYSPLVEKASAMIVMNAPSLARFLARLSAGGLLVLNTSLAAAPEDLDGALLRVPATDIANELGNIRVANMVMLGALNASKRLVKDEAVFAAFDELAGKAKAGLVEINRKAYLKGKKLAGK